MSSTAVALLFVPLLVGVLLNGVFGAKLSKRLSAWIGVLAVGLSFLGALLAWNAVRGGFSGEITLYRWIQAGSFGADVGFRFDPLSAVMGLIVTGVSFLIHIYSAGYMAHEERRGFSRYYAYLNLFVFAMLLLALANNYLLMFVGWEGVGLCSYLLIGYWYDRSRKPGETTDPPTAAKKAFIVNRIGDAGFLLGMFLLVWQYGTLHFETIFHEAELGHGQAWLTAATLLLFLGAVGKSAQIPLYVWLPDAMQGPTPVSALIHAATMVTAGVYMVARSHVLYDLAGTGTVVAWIGALTAIFAATMALAVFDFKGVLAYSTISQLGYMFVAVGLGAYSAGIAHLMTHAFFKALLFLAAGSVLHALHDVGDIRRMGGLATKLPVTFWTFLIAALAIAGFPLLSGFFSKDAILLAAYQQSRAIFVIGLITAGLTAFYIFRLLAIVFAGESRDPSLTLEAHESPPVMLWPMILLAIPSAAAGVLLGFREDGIFYRFLDPVFTHGEAHAAAHPVLPMVLSILVALIGIWLGFVLFRARPVAQLEALSPLLLRRKWYVDELYDLLIVRPTRWVSERILWKVIDLGIVDGIVNLVGGAIWSGGALLRTVQTGVVQTYAVVVVAGAVVILLIVLFG
ncbi:MAG: NADH-quinone oxidoreductase subunit L [Candidatus Poribacteria bacterium]|nr:MAG: NADH-quinone oxidoreductase subunit L [Candidatus Poribacteria bacterium]